MTEPVRPQLVRAHASALKKNRPLTLESKLASGLIVCVVLVAVVLFGVLLKDLTRLPAGVPIALAVLAFVLALIMFLWWRLRRQLRADGEGRYRLQNFATANDMTYHDQVADPGHPGMIFALGGERIATNVLRTSSAPYVEFGHHQVVTLSPSMWEWLFDTVTALNAKVARWERWRDAGNLESAQPAVQGRAPSTAALQPGVALAGQRLRTRQRGFWIVVGAVTFGLVGYLIQTV